MTSIRVLVLLCLVTTIVGCAYLGNEGGALSNVLGVTETAGPASVQFKVLLPAANGTGTQPPATAILRATTPASGATVIFRLTLVDAASNRVTTLTRTVKVDASGTVTTSFAGVPALSAVGEIRIEGGAIGGQTDFHGAADLMNGNNVLEVSPKGCGLRSDILANVVKLVANAGDLLSGAPANLVSAIESAGASRLGTTSATQYNDVLNDFVATRISLPGLLTLTFPANGETLSGAAVGSSTAWTRTAAEIWTGVTGAETLRGVKILRQGLGGFAYTAWESPDRSFFGIARINTATGQRLTSVTGTGRFGSAALLPDGTLIVGASLHGSPLAFKWNGAASVALTNSAVSGSGVTGLSWLQRFEDGSFGFDNSFVTVAPPLEYLEIEDAANKSLLLRARDPKTQTVKTFRLHLDTGVPTLVARPETFGIWAVPGPGEIVVDWDLLPGVSTYTLVWGVGSASMESASAARIIGVSRPFRHSGLPPGTTFFYQVLASDTTGDCRSPVVGVQAFPLTTGSGMSEITGVIRLPAGVPLATSSLLVLSNIATATVASNGGFILPFERPTTDGALSLGIVVNQNLNPVLLKLFRRGIDDANAVIDASSTAEAMVLYDLQFLDLGAATFTNVLAGLRIHADFPGLVQNVTSLLQAGSDAPLSLSAQAQVWAQAASLAVAVYDLSGLADVLPSIRHATTPGGKLGVEDDPPQTQPSVYLLNKYYSYYHVGITRNGDVVKTIHNNASWTLDRMTPTTAEYRGWYGWKPYAYRQAVEAELGDGQLTFTFVKRQEYTLFLSMLELAAKIIGFKLDAFDDLDEQYKFMLSSGGKFFDLIKDLGTKRPNNREQVVDLLKSVLTMSRDVILDYVTTFVWKPKKSNWKWVKLSAEFLGDKVVTWFTVGANKAYVAGDAVAVLYDTLYAAPDTYTESGEQKNGKYPYLAPMGGVGAVQTIRQALIPTNAEKKIYGYFDSAQPITFYASPTVDGLKVWEFGDGQTTEITSAIVHTYATAGTYLVKYTNTLGTEISRGVGTITVLPYVNVMIDVTIPSYFGGTTRCSSYTITLYCHNQLITRAQMQPSPPPNNWSNLTEYMVPVVRIPVEGIHYILVYRNANYETAVTSGDLTSLKYDGIPYPPKGTDARTASVTIDAP